MLFFIPAVVAIFSIFLEKANYKLSMIIFMVSLILSSVAIFYEYIIMLYTLLSIWFEGGWWFAKTAGLFALIVLFGSQQFLIKKIGEKPYAKRIIIWTMIFLNPVIVLAIIYVAMYGLEGISGLAWIFDR